MDTTEKIYYLPDDLPDARASHPDQVLIRAYQSSHVSIANRIVLNQNMINLLISGTKTIVYPDSTAMLKCGELVVLTTGNVLTSELLSHQGQFSSILLYFSNEVLNRFLVKYNHVLQAVERRGQKKSFLIFKQDDFIQQYITSLSVLLHNKEMPNDMMLLKLEELLLYLLHQDITAFRSLQILSADSEALLIKKVVETHVGQAIRVDHMAFLCHMSTSTFKRKFKLLYGTAPQRWLLSKKLEIAAALLQLPSESPSGVYHKVGYENHSSFSEAFRRQYGCSPTAYQQQQLCASSTSL